jgi:predicted permease
VAVAVLALGLGANVLVYAVVDALVLRPLPFRDPGRLAWLAGNRGQGGLSDRTYRIDAYERFREATRSFDDVAAYVPYFALSESKLLGRGQPRAVSFVWVTGNFLPLLGVRPALGRPFTDEEGRGARKAVLLTHAFWKRELGGDPAAVGRPLRLGAETIDAVGVLPPDFDFAGVFAPGVRVDYLRPLRLDDVRTWGHMLAVVGRLKAGVSVAEAQAEAGALLPALNTSHEPSWVTDEQTVVSGLHDHVAGRLRQALAVLWAAVGLVLLIACVNLSNLLMERAAARGQELAMRSALGAGRARLFRQLLTESALLWAAGALGGLALAHAALTWLAGQASIVLPLMSALRVDGTALAGTALATGLGAALFALASLPQAPARNLQRTLRDGGGQVGSGRAQQRLRAGLVIAEVALSCVLLVGAGLLLRSFLRVLDVDLGFEPAHAAALKVDLDGTVSADRRGAVRREILERVSALPGVEAAGFSDLLPLDRNRSWDLRAKDSRRGPDESHSAFVSIVTPGYFEAMGMRLRHGRPLSWQDTATSEPVIVINEAAARREWPGEDPIGRLAQGIGATDTRVVGVVSDVRESSLESASSPAVYVPVTQGVPDGAELVVRSRLLPSVLAPSLRATLRAFDPGQPAYELRPLRDIVDRSVSPRRFFALLVGGFAALGLGLASLGIYGVVAYSVSGQRRAIGVRMALGASVGRVRRDVLARTLRLAVLGLALGTVASLGLSRVVAALLYGTEPTDPATFAATALILAFVALAAGYLPARRASRIDPMVALRND